MLSFIAVLFIQSVTGFSPVSSSSARSALFANNHHNDYFDWQPMGIALTTLGLSWAMGSNPILAVDHPSLSNNNRNNDNYSMMMGSIPTLTVALSDSDYADFSLPSYKEVSSAEINTNLKGSIQIFSDSRFELSTSLDSSADSSKAAVKQTSAADLLADKAAAKVAAKAARERQLQAVEAAAAAK